MIIKIDGRRINQNVVLVYGESKESANEIIFIIKLNVVVEHSKITLSSEEKMNKVLEVIDEEFGKQITFIDVDEIVKNIQGDSPKKIIHEGIQTKKFME